MRVEDIARAVLDGEADAIVACDRDGIVRFWNAGAARIFGFGADEAIGRSLDLIIPERLRARHWHGWRETMATGTSRYSGGDTLSVPALRTSWSTRKDATCWWRITAAADRKSVV